ncbi:MAG: hypothetical protein H6Q16_1498 [Bacteroidetes bacterium]|nr:hypothetical protein [Bacteroidota bacterium]
MNLDVKKPKKKYLKSIVKVISYSLLIAFILVYFIIAFLNTSIVQSILAVKLSDYFSKEWKTEFRVGAVSINIFDGVALKDVYLEDRKGDTILYADNVSAKLLRLPTTKGIKISSVKLENTTFNVEVGKKGLNFGFIIDYFRSNKPKRNKPNAKPYVVEVNSLMVKNVNFSLKLTDRKEVYPKNMVAINNMRYSNISAEMEDISVIKDSINVVIEKFAAKEYSGLEVKNISGKFTVSPRTIIAKNANIKTLNSDLYFDAKMNTATWKTYSKFIDSVYCEGEIKKGSVAGMKDATYWAEVIKGFEQKASVSGKFRGTVSNLICDEMEVRTGRDTYVKAKGKIVGLPHPDSTIYDLEAETIQTSYQDYKSMQLGELLENLPIPEMVGKLGKINMTAHFVGLIKNFDVSAILKTQIGDIDVVGSSINNGKTTTYYADIVSDKFDVGYLLNQKFINTAGISAKAEVKGTDLNSMEANLTASLKDLNVKGINYDSVYIEGGMLNKEITAQLAIKDNDVNLNAYSEFYIGDKKTLYVDADINNADLYKLNLYKFADSTTSISGKMIADIQNLDLKHLSGNLRIEDLLFRIQDTNAFAIKNFNAQMSSYSDENNIITIYSDLVDFYMEGKYSFETIGQDIAWIVKRYIPNFNFLKADGHTPIKDTLDYNYKIKSDLTYNVVLKNPKPIFALFAPSIVLSNNTSLKGYINPYQIVTLHATTNKFVGGGLNFDNVDLDARAKDDVLNVLLNSSKFKITDSLALKNFAVDVSTNNKKLDFNLTFSDNLTNNRTSGNLNFKSFFEENSIQGGFENSDIEIYGRSIQINNENILSYNGDKLAILNLSLNRLKESIVINGIASKNSEDKMEVDFKNVDLQFINPFLKDVGVEVAGKINRNITFQSLFAKPFFTSNLIIDSLSINNNLLGFTELNVSNNLNFDEFMVDVRILYKGNEGIQNTPLSIKGFIYPESKKNNFNLNLSLQNFNLKVIDKFISSFASEPQGFLSGDNIKIRGTFKQPDIRGELICHDGALKINMINTKYYFSDTIKIDNNKFILDNFLLTDAQKNKLNIVGTITHDKFVDYYLNLQANAEKIKILNTNASSDQMYYGQAYASAQASILGDLSTLDIYVKAKTEKGTKLVIPISSKTSVSNNSFIKFTSLSNNNKDSISKLEKNSKKDMDLKVKVDLEVTPDAIISIPMNFSQIGGSLLASGKGDLKIDINNKGDFNMYGLVNIDNGTFGMSIINLIDKIFVLEEGGTIQFNGDPTNAYIDVAAVYKTKASLAPILGDKYSKQVDVNSVILLSGNLMNPVPKFDIRLPNTDQQTVDELFMHIDRNDEKQMIEQTVSLLISRQFYASVVENTTSTSTNLSSSAFGLAFGQMAGIITNMITFVDVGVNYTPGTEVVSDQFDVNLSKSIGRWEIEFNSVFGGKTQQQAQATSTFIGDIKAEYKFTDAFRFKVFNKSNANDFTKYNISPYTQGLGITYKKEYDSFADIFKSKKQRSKYIK